MTLNDINKAPINDQMKAQLKMLRSSPVLYNMLGLVPTECTWTIKVDDMERFVMNIAKQYLGNEVRMVTIEAGASKNKEPRTYVWLKADSYHLVDTQHGKNPNNVFTPKVDRYSEELKKFADLFAPEYYEDGSPINRKKRIRPLQNARGDKSIMAIPVSLSRVCKTMFDVESRAFQDTFGSDVPILRCSLRCDGTYYKRGDHLELSHITVTKYLPGKADKGKPSPKQNFRDSGDGGFRDSDDRPRKEKSNLSGFGNND